MPTLNTKSRENHEYQDMYRANLAAYWIAQPGELRADECIENIFAGGTGWAKTDDPNLASQTAREQSTSDRRDSTAPARGADPANHGEHGGQYLSSASAAAPRASHHQPSSSASSARRFGGGAGGPAVAPGVSGRTSLEQRANNLKAEAAATKAPAAATTRDIDELEIREDLKAWKLPSDRAAESAAAAKASA